MPDVESDRGVIGVPNTAPNVNDRVASHGSPVPLRGTRVGFQQLAVLVRRKSVRPLATHIDGSSALAVQLLAHVRLATTAADRLAGEDHLLVNPKVRDRDKEPLALPNEHIGFAAQSFRSFAASSSLATPHRIGLQRFSSCHDATDRSSLGHAGNEPVTFVVAAQKLVLSVRLTGAFRRLAYHQQQVAVPWLQVKDFDINVSIDLDIEELTMPVVANVDYDRPGSRSPTIADHWADCGPGSQLLELRFSRFVFMSRRTPGIEKGSVSVLVHTSRTGVSREFLGRLSTFA